jgi:hypothetical protein
MMKVEQYVPYEIAKLASEKGYTGDSLYWYNPNGVLIEKYDELCEGMETVSASDLLKQRTLPDRKDIIYPPTYQELVDWLRDKHNIIIYVESCTSAFKDRTFYAPCIYGINQNGITKASSSSPSYIKKISWFENNPRGFYSFIYYEAFNNGLEQALNLI